MVSAQQALQRLREGNRRFAAEQSRREGLSQKRLREVAHVQMPFAVVLGCSDSRVPVEVIFDQGVGDLFVIRVAGNVVTPSQVGSIEYAATMLGVRLVLVLGHSNCGVIRQTLLRLQTPVSEQLPNLQAIVDLATPAVAAVMREQPDEDADSLIARGVRANVCASLEQLRTSSPALAQLERDDGLVITGAEYSLDTGLVDFFGSALPADGQAHQETDRE